MYVPVWHSDMPWWIGGLSIRSSIRSAAVVTETRYEILPQLEILPQDSKQVPCIPQNILTRRGMIASIGRPSIAVASWDQKESHCYCKLFLTVGVFEGPKQVQHHGTHKRQIKFTCTCMQLITACMYILCSLCSAVIASTSEASFPTQNHFCRRMDLNYACPVRFGMRFSEQISDFCSS
jgi:hypothetical protein